VQKTRGVQSAIYAIFLETNDEGERRIMVKVTATTPREIGRPRQAARQADGQTGRQRGRFTDKIDEKQVDRSIDRHAYWLKDKNA
jgi:hypothetical protein